MKTVKAKVKISRKEIEKRVRAAYAAAYLDNAYFSTGLRILVPVVVSK